MTVVPPLSYESWGACWLSHGVIYICCASVFLHCVQMLQLKISSHAVVLVNLTFWPQNDSCTVNDVVIRRHNLWSKCKQKGPHHQKNKHKVGACCHSPTCDSSALPLRSYDIVRLTMDNLKKKRDPNPCNLCSLFYFIQLIPCQNLLPTLLTMPQDQHQLLSQNALCASSR